MIHCNKCGTANPDDAAFCYKCGAKIYVESEGKTSSSETQRHQFYENRKISEQMEVIPIDIHDAVYICIREKYFILSGRAKRAEYWYFQLFLLLIYIVLFVLSLIIGAVLFHDEDSISLVVFIVELIFCLSMFLPNLAVTVRRLHDIGCAGTLAVLNFIPLLNLIICVLFLSGSEMQDNKYGKLTFNDK